jgi:nicotinamide mononucleotide (NMN) deamidase PncC
VSRQTALRWRGHQGAVRRRYGVATTGIAGPGGATAQKRWALYKWGFRDL